jgi:hypothetical protein
MAKQQGFSLDVSDPEQVSQVLRNAVEIYYASASELESSWQEAKAGKPWSDIAKILEQASDAIDKKSKGWF